MSNIVERLTENIVARDLRQEGAALVSKWEKTGLLEGLGDDRTKDNMSRLLENQAKELLREASTMAAGDVEGFAAVAFPIVRRVFGGLLANDLVSVQPMSLPSGLIFFLDFQKANARLGDDAADSVYGGGVVGQAITGGVSLTGRNAEKSLYSLNNGYSSPVSGAVTDMNVGLEVVASGAIDSSGLFQFMDNDPADQITIEEARRILRYDPDLPSGTGIIIAEGEATDLPQLNRDDLVAISYRDENGAVLSGTAAQFSLTQVRRLTTYATASNGTPNNARIFSVFTTTASVNVANDSTALLDAAANIPVDQTVARVQYATADNFATGLGDPGSVAGTASWLLEGDVEGAAPTFGDVSNEIPEIDIKVDSVAVTAVTKKLRAKWSPELGQDLNAYHNLDAEVELTGILSEQVALEIDREILEDLIKRATAGTLHWSRQPGRFVNRETGADLEEASSSTGYPEFTGTVSEWYETLIETINDVSARIHRKTLRGGANFLVCSPEVANILEFTAGFRASVSVDSNGTAGAVNVGSISKKFDVYVDPYFPRNVVLVGRKGASFLESGYVYAPYVPLQVTPTIFGTEDFAPRKGVMTRYAKKMVRPDMYGLVICHNLVG
jgi:hypothetical protein